MAKTKVEDVVSALVEPVIEDTGMELVDVEYVKEGADWYLRVFIDKSEGVNLDDCQAVSEKIGPLLDEKDTIAQQYFMEVSSPGLNRPLKKEGDFERYKGQKIKVNTYAPIDGKKEFIGELRGLIDNNIIMDIEGEEVAIPRQDTAQVRLEVDF